MCGRFTLRASRKTIADAFSSVLPDELRPRYNIAPTQQVIVLTAGQRSAVEMRWGLPGVTPIINARSETVTTKPSFRTAFRERRCLVPADGFCEWQKSAGRRVPYLIKLRTDGLFALAGIWSGEAGAESFAVLTCPANDLVAPLHDRMPVILEPADYQAWLAPTSTLEQLGELLRPLPAERMIAYPVNARINSPSNDDARCIEPAAIQRELF